MRNRWMAGFALFFLVAALAWAGDPWREKSYTQWDERDVQRIVGNSPWARVVRVSAMWRDDRSAPRSPSGTGIPPANVPIASGGEAGEYGPPPAGGESVNQTPTAEFIVRWSSSLTMRQALVRASQLRGAAASEAMDKFLAEEPATYSIIILGPDMMPFRSAKESDLKQKTYLRLKKSKQKIAPESAEIRRSPDGRQVIGVLFQFAKRTASGEPQIAADEKGVEFFCQIDGITLKTNFEPHKMFNQAGQDL